MDNRLVCICGPTASGKTALSVALAKKLHTEIIYFYSRPYARGDSNFSQNHKLIYMINC